jgi:hypothetical protein
MQSILINNWNTYKNLISSKKLLVQYEETEIDYKLYATEGAAFIWATILNKDNGEEVIDFETNFKPSANKPLEYRSSDGLVKMASAKFVETLGFYLTGESDQLELSTNSIGYIKYHFDSPYTLSGVTAFWKDSNFGDYLDFEVGVYTSAEESSFVSLSKFASRFKIMGSDHMTIDVPTVKTIPPTINVGYGDMDTYIRIKAVNVGSSASKVIVNLVGWM